MTRAVLLAVLSLLFWGRQARAAVDLTVRNVGLSLGNSPRLTGLRINAVDDQVQSVDGLSLTLWNPGKNPAAAHRGLSVGLIGPKARTIDGLALGGLGAVAHHRLAGLAAATFGVGTDHLWGGAAGLALVEARKSLVGAALAGYAVDAPGRVWGVAASGWRTRVGPAVGVVFGGGLSEAESVRGLQAGSVTTTRSLAGLAVGLVFAGSDHLTGIVASPLLVVAERMRGVALGLGGAVVVDTSLGLGVGGLGLFVGPDFTGAALAAGFAGSSGRARGLLVGGIGGYAQDRFDGLAVSLGGLGSHGSLRGIALAGLVTSAADSITGVATGLGFVRAGRRIHGLALGGVTCLAPEVVGVSTGLFNGAMVQEVNLEDFLVIDRANERHTGLAIGLVNYTRELRGVQLGLLNWAGNNPPWLRLLPIVNVHI